MNARHLIAAAAAAFTLTTFAAGGGDEPARPSTAERLDSAHRYIKASNYNAALGELNTALREEPRNAEVHTLLGYTYRTRPSPDLVKSFNHYNTALRLDPKHKGAHEYIGEAYLMDRKPAEAEKHLAQLETICGKGCAEYLELAAAIEAYKAKAK